MKLPFSFKIGLAISILAVGATSSSLVFFYTKSKTMLLDQMGSRLKDIGRTSLYLFGSDELKAISKLKSEVDKRSLPVDMVTDDMLPGNYRRSLTDNDAQKLMQSAEFRRIVATLRKIKDSTRERLDLHPSDAERVDGPTLAYASVITTIPASKDRSIIRFIADADYADSEFPNPVGNLFYNNSEAIRLAFDGDVIADKDFRYENSEFLLSAGIPIRDSQGTVLAILTLDYNAKGEANMVANLKQLCIAIVAASFVMSLLVAALLAQVLNRPIRKLRAGAERVRDRNFDTRIDLNSKDELGLLADTFNAMVSEIRAYAQDLEAHNAAYAKFVPREFLEHLGHASILDLKLGDQVQRHMTILFADIRSFTTISESMSPRDNFDFINDYLKTISPIIRKHGGFVDKYIGDAIMALFPNSSESALNAAIEMIQALEAFNREGDEIGRPPIHIGVGLHKGNLMLGTIGESMRMESTVIADAVNLASRLEGLTKQYGSDIILSEKVYSSIAARPAYQIRALGMVQVKGKTNSVKIFELLNARDNDSVKMKIVSKAIFERGVAAADRKQYVRAQRCFLKVLRINKKDEAAKYMLELCKQSVLALQNESKQTQLYELTRKIQRKALSQGSRLTKISQKAE